MRPFFRAPSLFKPFYHSSKDFSPIKIKWLIYPFFIPILRNNPIPESFKSINQDQIKAHSDFTNVSLTNMIISDLTGFCLNIAPGMPDDRHFR